MKKVDCLGEICPIPVMKVQKMLKESESEFIIVSDHSCAVENLKDYCKNKPLELEIYEVINGVWEIKIKKHTL